MTEEELKALAAAVDTNLLKCGSIKACRCKSTYPWKRCETCLVREVRRNLLK